MTLKYKLSLTILLFIGGLVMGFIFLLRGCLAKYDELSALPRILYFKNANQAVVISLVKFEKATSYSQNGGFIQKTVSTNYYIQANDAITGNKLKDRKIKHQRDIKNYPVEIIGSSLNKAWVFMGELMAFDPFTLETLADINTLEEKNPALKGKFPAERRYYKFNSDDQTIYLTASDGTTWILDPQTLIASPSSEDSEESLTDKEAKRLENVMKEIETARDSLMEQKLRRPARMYAAREINMATYQKMMAGFNTEQTLLYKQRDSVRSMLQEVENKSRNSADIQRRISSLNERPSNSFGQIKVNGDSLNGWWYGLYSKKEMEAGPLYFNFQQLYDETARRRLYTLQYTVTRSGYTIADSARMKSSTLREKEPDYFLDGGFLLDKSTGLRIRLDKFDQFLVIFKDQIGNEGKIQLAKINQDKTLWKLDTQLKQWADYIYTGQQLIIFGTDDKNLSSDECNVLQCIDLTSGKAAMYHYKK